MTDSPRPFAEIEANPANHLSLYFYAAFLRITLYLRSQQEEVDLEKVFQQEPFLLVYFREMCGWMDRELNWDDAVLWWREQIELWEDSATVHLPLLALKRHSGLKFREVLALVMAGMVEEDSRFGLLYAKLQPHGAGHRPTLELLVRLLMELQTDLKPLLDMGLLEPDNASAPRSEWELKVPLLFWNYCRGEGSIENHSGFRHHPPSDFPVFSDLIADPLFLAPLQQVPGILARNQTRILILRGMAGSDRLGALGAVFRALNKGLLEVRPSHEPEAARLRHLGPLCALTGSIPVFHRDLGPGETFDLPVLAGYAGPIGFVTGLEGGYSGEETPLILNLPFPGPDLRRLVWQHALGDFAGADLDAIATSFHLPEATIRKAAGQAVLHAGMAGRSVVKSEDVRRACRNLNRQMLDSLASHVRASGTWSQLVVGATTSAQLQELVTRCRHRESLLDRLAPAFLSSANRGVRAMLAGPSGTGKTLAAKILAAQLGMDLYRVDLASVVSKYIGETEKNLHQVLSRAEELDVLLLIDEGDALLGNRTEVRSANDRYANLETNFLLQRLEQYQGIILITTNARDNIDKAFDRRMDVVINFLSPQAEERLRIWRVHLAAGHGLSHRDLEEFATRCELSGGQIRNAALFATLLAMDLGRPLDRAIQIAAIRAEYRKIGAISPLHDEASIALDEQGGLRRFFDLPN